MGDDKQPQGNPWLKSLLIWAAIILTMLMVASMIGGGNNAGAGKALPYSEFRSRVADGDVREVVIGETRITGKLANGEAFTTNPIRDPELTKLLSDKGVQFDGRQIEQMSIWTALLLQILPFALLLGLGFFIFRQVQKNSGGGAMGFGKSKAKLLTERQGRVTFNDVAGIEEAREELEEIVEFLKDPTKFSRLGGAIPKGALLVGAPGTGKTLLARAIAGEAGVPFFTISGSDFVEMFVGVGASRVRDMFEQAKKSAPCIVFIDEIDAVGRHRGSGMGNGNDEREQTLNQLLVEMDGFEANEGVIIIAATNRPDVLDPALLRPGRFDRQVHVPLPDIEGRIKILGIHMKKTPLAPDVDPRTIARGTPGFSGAELANLVNEAALLAARRGKRLVAMLEFEDAKDKVMMGAERRSMVMTDEDKKATAYHEAGHALVLIHVPGNNPLHKVTIIPRGRALGVTFSLPERDVLSHNMVKMKAQLAMAFGGRIAEQLIYGDDELNTGAASDIQQASAIARAMVTEYGMSKKLGWLRYKNDEDFGPFGGGGRANISGETSKLIDSEVRGLIEEAEVTARKVLTENLDQLHVLAGALLEYETLSGDEAKQVLAGEVLDRNSSDTGKPKAIEGHAGSIPQVRKRPRVTHDPAAQGQ
ncbi:MAG: ATP-dependent zinc metalloprotease FtsH [Pseudomonadota bacterium]